jgi:hypothetical protein
VGPSAGALGAGALAPAGVLPATGRSMRADKRGYRRALSAVEGRVGVQGEGERPPSQITRSEMARAALPGERKLKYQQKRQGLRACDV